LAGTAGGTLAAYGAADEETTMILSKLALSQFLHSMGSNQLAIAVEMGLPDEIDTDRDADLLSAAGLGRDRLRATLAVAGVPRLG
jgi:hypothetical protein